MENNQISISDAKVQATINLELTKLYGNVQKVLQGAASIQFDKNNLNQDYEPLKQLRKMVAEGKKIVKDGGRPYYDVYKTWNKSGNEFIATLEQVLNEKTDQFTTLANEVRTEAAFIEEQNRKTQEIQNSIGVFINETTLKITNAKNDTEIVSIQKAIGSEKSRITYYGDFISDLKSACDNLTPLINKRKEFIREETKLIGAKQSAIDSGDINKATEIFEKLEVLDAEIQENAIRIQEKAFEQSLNIPLVIPEQTIEVVKPRRTSWKWKVNSIETVQKKMPHLTEIVIIKEKVDELLEIKKNDGTLNAIESLEINGITLYLEKLY